MSPLKSDVRVARLQAAGYSSPRNCGKSGSLAIDSCSGAEAQWFKNAGIPAQVCGPAGACPAMAAGPGWNGTGVCGSRYSVGSSRVGLRSRWRVGWRWSQARGSSPMRASTDSYMARWLGRRTMGGDTTYLEPSRSGAGEAAKGAVLPPSWLCGARLPSVPRVRLTAALPGIGRRI